MKKFSILFLVSVLFITSNFLIFPAFADVIVPPVPIGDLRVCRPGEDPVLDRCEFSSSGRLFSDYYGINYLIIGSVIVAVTTVSLVALKKIGNKNAS